jgi:hypothetical protein
VLAFPCFLIGLFVSPLCGAALTFFAAAKKVSKESGLPPLARSEPSWSAIGNGPTRDVPSYHHPLLTQQSFIPASRFAHRRRAQHLVGPVGGIGYTQPSRTECVGGMNESCVTNVGSARDGLVFGPLREALRGGHLQAGGVSPLSLLTFFAAAKKVSAAPHRGEANRPIRKQGANRRSHNQRTPGGSPISNPGIGHLMAPASPDPQDRKPTPPIPGPMDLKRRLRLDKANPAIRRRHLCRHNVPGRGLGRPHSQNTPIRFLRPDRRSKSLRRRSHIPIRFDRRRTKQIQPP